MEPQNKITAERTREVLDYDPATGVFTWRTGRCVGKRAGNVSHRGHLLIPVDRVNYTAARLAWLHVTGRHANEVVVTRNGDPADLRFENLRECTRSEMQQSRRPNKQQKSGVRGVYFDARGNKWRARIRIKSVLRNLGTFDSAEKAAAAYLEAKKQMHAEVRA